MYENDLPSLGRDARHLRLDTFVRLRWLAITGQSAAVVGAHFGLGLPLPFGWCFLVIAASSWLNLALRIRFPASYRLSDDSAALLLAFDIVQLAALLFLTGGLALIVSTYFRFVARRLEQRPEDNPDAEVSDGAGDVGFFSPGSYWPVTLAGAAALLAISLAFFYVWAIVISFVLLLVAIGGLVFEYHLRPTDH